MSSSSGSMSSTEDACTICTPAAISVRAAKLSASAPPCSMRVSIALPFANFSRARSSRAFAATSLAHVSRTIFPSSPCCKANDSAAFGSQVSESCSALRTAELLEVPSVPEVATNRIFTESYFLTMSSRSWLAMKCCRMTSTMRETKTTAPCKPALSPLRNLTNGWKQRLVIHAAAAASVKFGATPSLWNFEEMSLKSRRCPADVKSPLPTSMRKPPATCIVLGCVTNNNSRTSRLQPSTLKVSMCQTQHQTP